MDSNWFNLFSFQWGWKTAHWFDFLLRRWWEFLINEKYCLWLFEKWKIVGDFHPFLPTSVSIYYNTLLKLIKFSRLSERGFFFPAHNSFILWWCAALIKRRKIVICSRLWFLPVVHYPLPQIHSLIWWDGE